MEALLQAIFSFFMIMGIGTSILLVIGFLLKAKDEKPNNKIANTIKARKSLI